MKHRTFQRNAHTIHVTTLDSGCEIISIDRNSVSKAIHLLARSGGIHDVIPGEAHYLEHMMAGAGPGKAMHELFMAQRKKGLKVNAGTSLAGVDYLAMGLAGHVLPTIEDLFTIMLKRRFNEEWVESERGAISEEALEHSADQVDNWREATLFPSVAEKLHVTGTQESIPKITAEGLRAYHKKHYHTGNMAVLAVGIDHERVIERVLPLVQSVPVGKPSEMISLKPRVLTDSFEAETSDAIEFHFAWPKSTEELVKLMFFVGMLGALEGPLMKRLRDKEELIYGVLSWRQPAPVNTVSIKISCHRSKHEYIIEAFFEELEKLLSNPIDAELWATVQTQMLTSYAEMADSTPYRLASIFSSHWIVGRLDAVDHLKLLTSLSQEEVQELARKWLNRKSAAILCLHNTHTS